MKLNIVFVSVCLMGAYGCIDAMDIKKKEYLKFKVDKELRIMEHKAKNMDFFVAPEKFLGEIITETIPLSNQDLSAMKDGFQKAMTQKKTQKIGYTLEDKQFVAKIKHDSKKDNFLVKVKEVRS